MRIVRCSGCPGVSAQGGACQTPPSEQNDWKTPVKILPCRNYVADGNDNLETKQSLNYHLPIRPTFPNVTNGNSATVLSLNYHSAIQTQTQTEPEAYRIHWNPGWTQVTWFYITHTYTMQWRIQNYPEVGAPTLGGGGANIQFCQIFPPKTAWNWKNLDLRRVQTFTM